MAELNPPQQAAVDTLAGPLLVLAGAGTGKTRVVTFRIANLIRHRIRPERILAVTFTNKAALEMKERIGHQLKVPKSRPKGANPPPTPVIGTFHSICVRILKRHAKELGYPEAFAIYDQSDQESVARGVLRELKIHDAILKPSDFLSFVGRWKNAGIRPGDASSHARTDKEHLAASGYQRYQRALKLRGAFDFDDLLLSTEMLLTEHEAIRRSEAALFDHILVDEYQDTNGSQYRIIKALASEHRNLCVVGDDDQSIYGWRGAEVQHILNFKNDWPTAVVVRLEDNYRSTAAILETANRLIAFNRQRHVKTLRAARQNGKHPRVLPFENEVEEARQIASEIARRLEARTGEQPRDFAILFRTNEQPRVFETELRRARLPYVLTGSQSFFDRKEIRDLLSYLRWLAHPADEVSLLRIINTPPRGIGAKSIETMIAAAVQQGKPLWDLCAHPESFSGLPVPAEQGLAKLRRLHDHYATRFVGHEMVPTLRAFIDELGYEEEIGRLYPDPEEQETRKGSIQELVNAMAEYSLNADQPSLDGFLAEVALSGKDFGSSKEKQETRNAISLMTLHSAKGLEFPYVYMVGMEEGFLPHKKSILDDLGIDEERRLCYVGVTRAQDELTLTLANTRFKWGKPRPTHMSRFLYEMTGQADNPNMMKAIRGARDEQRKAIKAPSSKGKKFGS